ncbi:MAG: hypothetical protein RIS47_353, partial [Bacteroidota bacterium]
KTGRGNQTALVYDSPMADASQSYSFAELLDEVSRLAGAMRSLGVKQGDTVVIYMPAVPEAVFAMLACARIGAIHSVVFGGFAAHELALRINDAKPSLIVSASAGFEGTRILEYKPLLDAAVQESIYKPKSVLVLQRKPVEAALVDGRDFDYRSLVTNAEPVDCVWVDASDPLYVLYTSGTTGKPKGIVRDTGGYAVALKYSMTNVFDMKPGQVFWAASDVGWVVGHSYIVYGPLLHACTTVLYEGKPVKTPDAGAFARIIEAYKVNVLLTAPTALRAIRKDDPLGLGSRKYDMSSLNYVFVAGERCDVATYHWAKGLFKKPVIDHWWQTESGWPMVSNMPGLDVMPTKEGSVTQAVCGFDVRIVDETGCELLPNQEGLVVVKLPLPPGFSQKLWGDGDSFKDLYLSQFPGYYTTGDGGYIDEDGYVYISGRTDDVINVAGHRLSTSEMEEIIASHKAISECAVFGIHDELKGQLPIALAVAKDGFVLLESDLEAELAALIRNQIGAVAVFKTMVLVSRLPKTRSGKIMRKTMRKIADGEHYQVPTTIEDPSVLSEIRTAFKRRKIGAAFEKSVTVSNRIRTREDYDKAYQLSVDNPDQFWGDLASQFTWRQKWDKVCEGDFSQAQVKWFTGGKLNITENMLDRHLETRGNKLAIIWEPNDPKERFVRFTYREVYQEVNKFANVLKNNGVKKGDRVAIYMPMIPELAFAVMACARIGAVHSVVFAGFSASALADRINDATAVAVITSDGIFRGAKQIPAKAVVDEALENCYSIRKVIVVERTGWMVNMVEGRDVWYHHEITKVSDQCPAEVMDAEDPLFILYTSGSTGKPKGIQHTVAGYMLYADYTFRNVFQGEESDVFWCTADVGWVTGHSYIVYGPLLAGAT